MENGAVIILAFSGRIERIITYPASLAAWNWTPWRKKPRLRSRRQSSLVWIPSTSLSRCSCPASAWPPWPLSCALGRHWGRTGRCWSGWGTHWSTLNEDFILSRIGAECLPAYQWQCTCWAWVYRQWAKRLRPPMEPQPLGLPDPPRSPTPELGISWRPLWCVLSIWWRPKGRTDKPPHWLKHFGYKPRFFATKSSIISSSSHSDC